MSHDIETRYWLAYGTGWLMNPFLWWMEQINKVSPEREGMERAAADIGEGSNAVRSLSTGGTG